MPSEELIPHLFRTEFSKITAVLCSLFGIEHIQVAEDIAAETFLSALEIWSFKGIPPNPTAWLYTVAKNKTRNIISRDKTFYKKIAPEIKYTSADKEIIEIDLSDKNITDSQLQMLFAVCHPSVSTESQISLALRVLCGFGNEEIANAFLTNKETINKRLFRVKEKFRSGNIKIEFPAEAEINNRLEAVLTTLYLLYNEGYYSESNNSILREDLCFEAMRLTQLLIDYPLTNKPAVSALMALMCFQSSRFSARKNKNGDIVLYDEQDETLWDYELIAKGAFYLHKASQGKIISKYHLEAGIAYWHTIKTDTIEKWENILQFYNQLLQVQYSPIAALNRTYALSKVYGKEKAICEAEKLQLIGNHYYYTLLGELHKKINNDKAKAYFEKAHALARTQTDKALIKKKIKEL